MCWWQILSQSSISPYAALARRHFPAGDHPPVVTGVWCIDWVRHVHVGSALPQWFSCDGMSDHWNEVFHYWDTKLSCAKSVFMYLWTFMTNFKFQMGTQSVVTLLYEVHTILFKWKSVFFLFFLECMNFQARNSKEPASSTPSIILFVICSNPVPRKSHL